MCVDRRSWQLKWQRETSHSNAKVHRPVGEFLVCGWMSGPPMVLDVHSGNVAWETSEAGKIEGFAGVAGGNAICLTAPPDSAVVALRASDGKVVWKRRPVSWGFRIELKGLEVVGERVVMKGPDSMQWIVDGASGRLISYGGK